MAKILVTKRAAEKLDNIRVEDMKNILSTLKKTSRIGLKSLREIDSYGEHKFYYKSTKNYGLVLSPSRGNLVLADIISKNE